MVPSIVIWSVASSPRTTLPFNLMESSGRVVSSTTSPSDEVRLTPRAPSSEMALPVDCRDTSCPSMDTLPEAEFRVIPFVPSREIVCCAVRLTPPAEELSSTPSLPSTITEPLVAASFIAALVVSVTSPAPYQVLPTVASQAVASAATTSSPAVSRHVPPVAGVQTLPVVASHRVCVLTATASPLKLAQEPPVDINSTPVPPMSLTSESVAPVALNSNGPVNDVISTPFPPVITTVPPVKASCSAAFTVTSSVTELISTAFCASSVREPLVALSSRRLAATMLMSCCDADMAIPVPPVMTASAPLLIDMSASAATVTASPRIETVLASRLRLSPAVMVTSPVLSAAQDSATSAA